MKKISFKFRERSFSMLILDEDHVSEKINKYQNFYEFLMLDCLLSEGIIDHKSVVVDAGAFIGNHTVFFGTFCKKVYAFEPLAKSHEILLENIRLNKLKGIWAYQKALAAREGFVETRYYAGEKNLGAVFWWYEKLECNLSWYDRKPFREVAKRERCWALALDDVVAEKIDLLKIDVEGMELEVLAGAKQTIADSSPAIMIEVLPGRTDSAVLEWAAQAGYRRVLLECWGRNPEKNATWLLRKGD